MQTPMLVISGLGLLLVGALLGQLTAARAETPPKQYTQCVGALTWALSDDVTAGKQPSKVTRIPPGWTPIGGEGRVKDGIIIICR
jgi:hypothetical protein